MIRTVLDAEKFQKADNMLSNTRRVSAKLIWIPFEEGGRRQVPHGSLYSTVARFEKEIDKWPIEAWSIVLESMKTLENPNSMLAEIRFLVQNAPVDLLESGNKFELFEGHKLVARGEVLKDCTEIAPNQKTNS